ncbi:flippase-like domain-containing protein [Thiomicrorhabdus sp. 6S2-11]|uniref:Flippase-like domain-containing protein n=1 Tax=Thiomicrorhabdus marina TaxID=2818442 RepID=A0ABS3Q5T6_9GAMM|nr:lysylphosphatidylglycerol synthase domain-containing protein [Thiomicrorhabdus marina]MBO1927646.1 flippase-like domain-containing protein [Thiomicrorhabdus marina]
MPHLKWIISSSLLLALAALVEYFIGWHTVFAPWQTLPTAQVAMATALLFITYAVRAGRLIHYFQLTQTRQMLGCARLMLLHNFWNNLLPMRSGEASFPILMKSQFQIGLEKSLPALLWFRILDLHTLLLIALIALASLWLNTLQILAVSTVWLAIPFMLYALQKPLLKLFSADHKLNNIARKIIAGLPQNLSQFGWSWLWTIVNWTIKLLVLAWILSWFIDIDYNLAILGSVGGELSSVLPIHGIGGFGTYEAGVWLALSQLELTENSVVSAAINLHLLLLSSSILSAIFAKLLPKN